MILGEDFVSFRHDCRFGQIRVALHQRKKEFKSALIILDCFVSESAQHDFQGRHSPCSTILRYGNFLPGNVEQDVPDIAAALRATARIAGLALFESRRLGRTAISDMTFG